MSDKHYEANDISKEMADDNMSKIQSARFTGNLGNM